jgi:hypothetical protein
VFRAVHNLHFQSQKSCSQQPSVYCTTSHNIPYSSYFITTSGTSIILSFYYVKKLEQFLLTFTLIHLIWEFALLLMRITMKISISHNSTSTNRFITYFKELTLLIWSQKKKLIEKVRILSFFNFSQTSLLHVSRFIPLKF